MLRLVISFLLIIPQIQSETDVSDVTEQTTTEQIFSSDTDSTVSSPVSFDSSSDPIITTPEPLSSETSSETSEQTSTTSITSAAITSVTTEPSFTLIFQCNFTDPCFGDGQLNITDGSEFNPKILAHDTPPPSAPLSDVTSITEPTNNNETCQLPYQPSLDDDTETTIWNMSFCYHEHCPTESDANATCARGFYGLISLNASETSKTVSQFINLTDYVPDSIVEQRLRFYYYFTVYENQTNWNQQIQIWIKPNNETSNQFSIGNLTINDMNDYKWQFRELTFSMLSENYTLEFLFKVDVNSSNESLEFNETIYFALDNIELYNFNYLTTSSSTTTSAITSIGTTSTVPKTTKSGGILPDSDSNMGKIIDLSLGIGIPVLIVFIGGIVLYKKKNRPEHKNSTYDIPLTSTRPRTNSDIFSNPFLF